MPKTDKEVEKKKRKRPALTPEDRENQLISLAVDQAEKQLSEGKAPTQVVIHYLKLATEKQKLETMKLAKETELLQAKTESIQSQKKSEELYAEALKAMRSYAGMEEEYED